MCVYFYLLTSVASTDDIFYNPRGLSHCREVFVFSLAQCRTVHFNYCAK